MFYRDPWSSNWRHLGADEVIDFVCDAFWTVALAEGGDTVAATIGWYDVLSNLFWPGECYAEMALPIISVATARVEDELPQRVAPPLLESARDQLLEFTSLLRINVESASSSTSGR